MIGEISISATLASKHNIPLVDTVRIRVGNNIVNSRLRIRQKKGYAISSSLAAALGIKSSKHLKIRYDSYEGLIHLGPIIGVLVTALPNRADTEEIEPTSLQAELTFMSRVGRRVPGIVYIFLPQSISWTKRRVKGYNYRWITPERGVWESSLYPLPDVVYNRISSRKAEIRSSVKSTLQKLNELPYTRVFNSSYLNKYQVHNMLINNPQLQKHLPETMRLTEESLENMLQKYNVLYLKPSAGSLGRGIIKVRKLSNGKIKYTMYTRGRINGHADSAVELMKKTSKRRKEKPYIVQEGLNLARYRGHAFDIRIIYQKNGKGEWQIGKKFVRVAPGSSSISNLSRGGTAERSKKVFNNLFGNKTLIDAKNMQIKNLCEIVANTINKESEGLFGELGLDIGIDKKGWPWIIEVNSKPRKTTETEASQAVMRNAFKRPLEYGGYLAGFGK